MTDTSLVLIKLRSSFCDPPPGDLKRHTLYKVCSFFALFHSFFYRAQNLKSQSQVSSGSSSRQRIQVFRDLADLRDSADLANLRDSADFADLRDSADLADFADFRGSADFADFTDLRDLADLRDIIWRICGIWRIYGILRIYGIVRMRDAPVPLRGAQATENIGATRRCHVAAHRSPGTSAHHADNRIPPHNRFENPK
jgi:hypothetical protein